MKRSHWQWLKRLLTLMEIPATDPPRLLRRIEITERDIIHAVVQPDIEHVGHRC
jgi:hypothetical protein